MRWLPRPVTGIPRQQPDPYPASSLTQAVAGLWATDEGFRGGRARAPADRACDQQALSDRPADELKVAGFDAQRRPGTLEAAWYHTSPCLRT